MNNQNNQTQVAPRQGDGVETTEANSDISNKSYRSATEERVFNNYYYPRFRIPGTEADSAQLEWFEVFASDKPVEVIDGMETKYRELAIRFSEMKPQTAETDRRGMTLFYSDGAEWDAQWLCYDPDAHGESFAMSRVVHGMVDPQVPGWGVQRLWRETFKLADGTVHTFDLWRNANDFHIDTVEGYEAQIAYLSSRNNLPADEPVGSGKKGDGFFDD